MTVSSIRELQAADRRLHRQAWILGVAGILPFVAHAALVWWLAPAFREIAIAAQLLYAAVVLSFVGAIHWGIAVTRSHELSALALFVRLAYGVFPGIYAYVCAQLVYRNALGLLAVGFLLTYCFDWFVFRRDESMLWYLNLRLAVTVVVIACLITTVAALP